MHKPASRVIQMNQRNNCDQTADDLTSGRWNGSSRYSVEKLLRSEQEKNRLCSEQHQVRAEHIDSINSAGPNNITVN